MDLKNNDPRPYLFVRTEQYLSEKAIRVLKDKVPAGAGNRRNCRPGQDADKNRRNNKLARRARRKTKKT